MLKRLLDWIKAPCQEKPLRDYIFTDHTRILSYFQQISSPHKLSRTQRVPIWTASLSVKGPVVSGTESLSTRSPTVYEMIDVIEKYLRRKKLVDNLGISPEMVWGQNLFCHCRLSARRALIRLEANQRGEPSRQLGVWIPDKTAEAIYLIEASSESDLQNVPSFSAYSALDYILHQLNSEQTLFRKYLLNGRDIQITDISTDERFRRFAEDPDDYLTKMGAYLGPVKMIECLFRVRLSYLTFVHGGRICGGAVGYPLYVSSDIPSQAAP